MQAILTSGHTIECANFKAIDSGVVLTADEKRKQVIGFVPNERLAYVVPDDRAPELVDVVESEGKTGSGSESEESGLADRLDAIEARFDELTGGVGEPSTVETGVSITVQEEAETVDETGTNVDVVYDESETEPAEEHGESQTEAEAPEGTSVEESEAKEEADETAGETLEATEGVESEAEDDAESTADEPETDEPETDERGEEAESDAGAVEPEAEVESGEEQPETEGEAAAARGIAEKEETAAVEDEVAEVEAAAESGDAGPESKEFESEEPESPEPEAEDSELTTLRGLGPTYAGRLEAAGIATLDDVRAASVEELAEAADVAESRADDWKRQVAE
jgi:predicted flap endonuclease-1-like 5' DNA nuclease